jgi:2-polyprenyl-3-methyl-5-hydroxy-6-metoxy-1,4-benzoquinol methylase
MNQEYEILRFAFLLSDVDFVRWYCSNHSLSRAAVDLVGRQLPLYEFSLSDEAYLAHYDHHEGKFYAESATEFARRDWSQEARVRAIWSALLDLPVRPRRVLDYGCATGHVSAVLAKRMPDVEFVGTDIMQQAVDMVRARAVPNLTAARTNALTTVGQFDAIICAEVLEHVRDPYTLLDTLEQVFMMGGGRFIITVPSGPWEAEGFDANPGGREHLRHWGAIDLSEVFMEAKSVYLHSHVSRFGITAGHTVCVARGRAGVVNMERKLRYYRLVLQRCEVA